MKKPYTPPLLPPNLSTIYTTEFVQLLGEANRALAKLGELPNLLPNINLVEQLSAPLLKKEAVLSSKIEGTLTTLSEFFKYEADISDIEKIKTTEDNSQEKEVENYVKAMQRGMRLIPDLSLSLRTIKGMHKALLAGVRNEQGIPGEFRDFEAYIGRRGTSKELASYIASPPDKIKKLMGNLEDFMNKPSTHDQIIECAIIHYQFEAIHPFGDGNGRMGRLLIPLFFYYKEIIRYPLIYVSEYFERHRSEYYNRLLGVSEKGDWDSWIRFFLKALTTQSNTAFERGERIVNLYRSFHDKQTLSLKSSYALTLIDHIFRYPYTAAPFFARETNIPAKTARSLLEKMAEKKLLRPSQGIYRRRPVKVYVFDKLLRAINE